MNGTTRALRTVTVLLAFAALAPTCINYKLDVEKLCDAEHLSGASMKTDSSAVLDWMKKNVGTSEGIVLANELATKDARGRSVQLRTEAQKQSVAACPVADSCDAIAKADDYKDDIANLCQGRAIMASGSIARLDIVDLEDAERIREIREWSTSNSKSPDTAPIVVKVITAPPKDRGGLLRGEATRLGVTACPLADALDRPAAPPPPKNTGGAGTPIVKLAKFEGGGDKTIGGAVQNIIGDLPQMQAVSACYGDAFSRNPKLKGNVNLKFSVDTGGRVTKVSDNGSDMDKNVVTCVSRALQTFQLAKTKTAQKYTVMYTMTAGK